MRIEARLKLGFYPLPAEHGPSIRVRLKFPPANSPATALDPCAGAGAALKAITESSGAILYGVELDANRADACKRAGIQTVHGNIFDVRCRVERLSLLYLNPPYDFEIGELQKNQRMEKLFLAQTYTWLKPKGVLVMVIPGKAISEVLDTLATRFRDVRVYRMSGERSEQYDQYTVFGVRYNNTAKDADAIRAEVRRTIAFYGPGAPDLTPDADCIYRVPIGGDVVITHSGIPLDDVEDRLLDSGAWANVAPMLLPKREVTGGRPITPLHGGHVGLLATAGMINGVFGKDDERHIARWRPVKYTTVTKEEDEDGNEITHTRERFSNELALVYVCGTTTILTETDKSAMVESNSDEQQALDLESPESEDDEPEEDEPEEEESEEEKSSKSRTRFITHVDLDLDSDAHLADGDSMEREFEPGKVVISPGVHTLIVSKGVTLAELFKRHLNGDGCAASDLQRAQNNNLDDEWRCESRHDVPEAPGGRIYIVTEKFKGEEPGTTILFYSEM
jgi:hypothetical protein